MIRSSLTFCLVMLLCVSLASAQDEEKKKKRERRAFDVEKLLGDWSYQSGKRAGEDVSEESLQGTVTFTKETVTLPGGPDAKFVMAYELDTSKRPTMIDLEIKSGPVPEGKAQGIIRMNEDRLTICYIPGDSARPEKFESTKENGAFMFVLKRKTKE